MSLRPETIGVNATTTTSNDATTNGSTEAATTGNDATKSAQKWIGIAPFAAHEGKIYPPELMRSVLKGLTERYPEARIFLFGRGQQEDSIFPEWCKEFAQCVHVGPLLGSIQQELILMSHLDVMLSMDSANMHMASLTATPVVSVWGATHPYAGFMGWNQSASNAIQMDMPCRPCSIFGNKPCIHGDYPCLRGIKPETIVDKIAAVIEGESATTNEDKNAAVEGKECHGD